MSGLSDLLGRNGAIEQLLLWGAVNQTLAALMQPALTALTQDVQHAHPETALDATTVAEAEARGMLSHAAAENEAARSGIDASRYATLSDLHKVRLAPADLATAVLRSYLTMAEAEAQAGPQGISPQMLRILADLAGDAPGPQDAARALQRGLIPEHGTGPNAVSYEQAIAESRLHDKYAPVIRELARVLLSPADAASAVVRNFLTGTEGTQIAGQNGVDSQTFSTLVQLSGDAPAPGQLAEALRRGAIPETGTGAAAVSFQQGIAEGRLADKWAPVIKDLAKSWPTPVDALDAWVKGQLTEAEARDLYAQLGGDLQFLPWLYHSIGEGPTPLEAASLANRGIIGWSGSGPDKTTYEQAVHESRYRDKWQDAYRELARYIPAPGEIITFLAHGAITKDDATQLLAHHGMDAQVIEAYLNEAELTALSDYRGLTISSVISLYHAHLISTDLATQILATLHVAPQAASLLLAYDDMRQATDSVTKAVSRIGTLYTSHKIGAPTAREALTRLEVPPDAIEAVLADWEIEASANVRTLTEAQITDAWYYGIIDQPTAMDELQAIGYTAFDGWVLLSVKAKGPLPGKPAYVVAPPTGAVIPGVT